MSTQKLIELLNSDAFLVIAYSLFFIVAAFFALKILAKLVIFAIYICFFVFAASIVFSSTNGGKIDFNIAKIYKNAKSYVTNTTNLIKDSKKLFTKLNDFLKQQNFSNIISDSQDAINDLAKDGKNALNKVKDMTSNENDDDIFIEIED